jgi:hypothetical protein
MDSHDRDHRLLAAFLTGELAHADVRRFDEHLLECEACWRALREDRTARQAAELLRHPAPPGLADRVAFAVEVAATAHVAGTRQTRTNGRLRWRLAGAGALALSVITLLAVLLWPGGNGTPSMPAAVAAVAHYAQAVPAPARERPAQSGRHAAPVPVGSPETVTAGGQRIVLRTWRLGGLEAVVAVSGRPFPMPAGARGVSGGGMAWSARLGRLELYCINGQTSELVAAPVPAAELATVAPRLPLT